MGAAKSLRRLTKTFENICAALGYSLETLYGETRDCVSVNCVTCTNQTRPYRMF